MATVQEVFQDKKSVRRTNSDLWRYTLLIANGAVFLISLGLVLARTKSSDVKVPIRLISSNELVQGNWWNSYLSLGIIFGFFVLSLIYSARLNKLNPLYRNGVLVLALCLQILAAAILYRVAGLSSLV
jgi:hypothetical protein